MKLSRRVLFLTAVMVLPCLMDAADTRTMLPASNSTVLERGPNHKIVQRVAWQTNALGQVSGRTNTYTELATGLHYQENGVWKESKEDIEILRNGAGAVAQQSGYKVRFAVNLNTAGAIDMETPDGKRLRSHVLGLGYYDAATGESVIIAEVQDSIGQVVGKNVVLYTNAFIGLRTDVRYTYRRSGFEQDVILREQPPTPEEFGLNPKSTRLEVFTEFLNPPTPVKTARGVPGTALTDEQLDFGKTTMVQGKAFPVGESGHRRPVLTGKSWESWEGRTFLIEEVEYQTVKPELAALPRQASAVLPKSKSYRLATKTSPADKSSQPRQLASTFPKPAAPVTPRPTATEPGMLLASVVPPSAGYVLDYVTVNSALDDFTFAANTTYFIDGNVYLTGITTFEGSAILKYGLYGSIEIGGQVVCNTSIGHPAHFTSMNDDDWGDTIDGSTGSLSSADVQGVMLYFSDSQPIVLKNLLFRWGAVGVASTGNSDIQAWHCEFKHMQYYGISADNLTLRNVRFNDVGVPYDYACEAYLTLDAQHVTVNKSPKVWGMLPDTAVLTNCLFTEVAYTSSASSLTTEAVETVPSPSPCPYYNPQPNLEYYLPLCGSAGNHLIQNSPYRNVGMTNIDPALLADIRQMTTYWPGQAPAYAPVDTGLPDLGFHYPSGVTTANALDTDGDGMVDVFEDSNHNGVFDAGDVSNWQAADTDGDGPDDLAEYLAGTNPNTIVFFPNFENYYVNSSTVHGNIELKGGVPAKIAVLINNENFAAATWQTYTGSNFTFSIGATDGVYQVWIGLRGLGANSEKSWQWASLTRDTVPPQIVITNPVASVTSRPMLQLLGYSPEQLTHISFDVTNAAGMLTNQDGGVTEQYIDPVLIRPTTNWFQCLDIELADGLNTITLRVTDMAGNTSTNTYPYTLDYSGDTTPPVLAIEWPIDGEKVSGSSFTLRGILDDPTATITVEIVSSSGVTNTRAGLVERKGLVWVEDLPLSSGVNSLTLTLTDAAGNMISTNISVVKSDITLIINPVPSEQLVQPTVTVSGTISVNDRTVWVNGVKATGYVANGQGGYDWEANDVPTGNGGTVVFQATAIPNSDNGGNGAANSGQSSSGASNNPSSQNTITAAKEPERPPMVFVEKYSLDEKSKLEWSGLNCFECYESGIDNWWQKIPTWTSKLGLMFGATSSGEYISGYHYDVFDPDGTEHISCSETTLTCPPDTYIPSLQGQTTTTSCSAPPTQGTGGLWAFEHEVWEHHWKGVYLDNVYGSTSFRDEDRTARMTMKLWTGGKANSKKKHLFVVSASATKYTTFSSYSGTYDSETVPPTSIQVLGKSLNAQGVAYKALADNDILDITPIVEAQRYKFAVPTPAKQCLPHEIKFEDIPRVKARPWHGKFRLDAVCGDNINSPLASFEYQCDVDSGGNITISKSGDGTAGSCGVIVVDTFEKFNPPENPVPDPDEKRAGVHVIAHYIGCCDSTLRWRQRALEDTSPPTGKTPPYDDYLPSSTIPPFYYSDSDPWPGRGMNTLTFDYESPCP